jgi:hypothetical protein
MAFWNKASLEAIRNKLGRFMALEPNWKSKFDKCHAWILLEFNLKHNLIGDLELVFEEFKWNQ